MINKHIATYQVFDDRFELGVSSASLIIRSLHGDGTEKDCEFEISYDELYLLLKGE